MDRLTGARASALLRTMKIFLLFTICLIKGHMGDGVQGIAGGSVIINFQYPDKASKESVKSFCRVSDSECTDAQSHLWIPEERISMTENKTLSYISVLIRNLTVNDSGKYEWKANRKWIQEVNLVVKQEPCCERSEEQIYLGGSAVIRCRYPETFKGSPPLLFKEQNGSLQNIISYRGGDPRISLNTEKDHVFTVTITNVSRSDDGLYFCGAVGRKEGQQISYSFIFKQIHLHATEQTDASNNSGHYTTVYVTVCVCLVVLLSGGLSLLFLKRRCSVSDQRNTGEDEEKSSSVYYATIQDSGNTASDPSDQRPISLNTVYATAHSPTNPSDLYTLAEQPQNTTQS